MSTENKTLQIINIYTPNKGNERKRFFNTLGRFIITDDNTENILIGDFNCVFDKSKDRNSNQNMDDIGCNELNTLIATYSLQDIWRIHNPDTIQYTFHRGLSKSRIDMILTHENISSLLSNIKIKHCPFSDHKSISMKLLLNESERGPGSWKLSEKVIKSDIFQSSLEACWKHWIEEKDMHETILEWWDITKIKIKELAMEVGKQINIKVKEITRIEDQLDTLVKTNCNDPVTLNTIEKLQTKIKQYHNNRADAAKVRSRIQDYEEGEKSTRYFFGLEKKNAENTQWFRIKNEDGHYVTGIDNILHEQIKFYKKLFSSDGWDSDKAEKLTECIENKLTEEESIFIERPIEQKEITTAINNLKLNKSPGEDGITT